MELNREQRRSMARRRNMDPSPVMGKCPNHMPNVVVSWRPIYHQLTLPDGKRNPQGGRVARLVADRLMCVKCGFISPSVSEDVIDTDKRDIEEANAVREQEAVAEAGKKRSKAPEADEAKGENRP